MKKLSIAFTVLLGCASGEGEGGDPIPWDGSVFTDASGFDASGFDASGFDASAFDAGASLGDGAVARDGAAADAGGDSAVDGSAGGKDAGTQSTCAQATGKPGTSTFMVDGRSVTLYVPAKLQRSQAAPVVINLHGFFVPAASMPAITGIPAVADREGFIGVFPEGALGSWNTNEAKCGLGSAISSGNDDVAFLSKVLDEVAKLQCIDRHRVYITGFSMGGYGAEALVCMRPDLFRAAVGHSSGAPGGACKAAVAPVMMLHGTTDGTIAYECATMARDFWVAHNGCSTEVDTVMVKGGKCERHRGCPANGEVELCSFEGMGHGWAGSTDLLSGGGDKFENATELMWTFLKAHP